MEEKLNTCLWHVRLQIVSERKKERKSRGQHHAGDATASVTDAKWVEHERLLCARFFSSAGRLVLVGLLSFQFEVYFR